MEKLKFLTGFIPREIRFLKETNDFKEYEEMRTKYFRSNVLQLYKKSDDDEKNAYNEFLKHVLTPRF